MLTSAAATIVPRIPRAMMAAFLLCAGVLVCGVTADARPDPAQPQPSPSPSPSPSPTPAPIPSPPNAAIPSPTSSTGPMRYTLATSGSPSPGQGTFGPALAYKNPAHSSVWSTDQLQIMVSVNGGTATQFFAEGVNYEPTPIGSAAGYSPFNDFFSGTAGSTWSPLWARDIPILRALGVNTIRTYGWWKWEPAFYNGTQNFSNWSQLDFTVSSTTGSFTSGGNTTWPHATHDEFLDLAWNGGQDPIYVWIGLSINTGAQFENGAPAGAGSETEARQFMKWTTLWAATKYGNHPAVMGFVIGNEQNQNAAGSPPPYGTTQTTEFWYYMNELNAIVKTVAPNKLTMSVFTDDPNVWESTIQYVNPSANAASAGYNGKKPPEVYQQDVWGLNPYTNPTLSGGILARYYNDIVALDKTHYSYVKPLLFTEWGVPTSTHTYDGTHAYPGCWWTNVWVSPQPACTSNPVTAPPGSPGPTPALGTSPNTTDLASTYVDANGKSHSYALPAALASFFPSTSGNLAGAQPAWWLEQFWAMTVANKANNAALSNSASTQWTSGGYVFEWVDEWWKDGFPTQKDGAIPTGNNGVFPGGWDDEEYFGLTVGALNGRTCTAANLPSSCQVVDPSTGLLNGNADTLTPKASLVAIYNQYN